VTSGDESKPIEDKRRKLYPVLKDAKRQGKHAVLVRDKLFINGSQYLVDDSLIFKRRIIIAYTWITYTWITFTLNTRG
jgi:hypothetical protein